jgi:hypothetical protein
MLALSEFNNKHLAGKRSIGRAIGDYQVSMIDLAFTTGTLFIGSQPGELDTPANGNQ